jgi:SAM-dependent methyltransferase/uncharacterized protein YbaR (Trm112 family)
MKERALALLACPACGGGLAVTVSKQDGVEILQGELMCRACSARYAITAGIPRFAGEVGDVEQRTAAAFGYEWTQYSELADRYRTQFLDWIKPVGPEFFKGKAVLEGGCGKGRHTALAAQFGVREIVAMDLSDAVDAAFANTRRFDNVHIVQADMNRPPVRRAFDYAFSIGVLHHLPDPERGFQALVSRLRSGGAVSAWVYGREGNGWIVHGVTPIREHVTSHLPHRMLDTLSAALTVPLFAATKLLYRTPIGPRLPYGQYLSYIAKFPYREQRSIVFDHLVAPVAFYLRRDEFAAWFERAGMQDVKIEHHNANSWRGFGRLPPGAA